MMISLSHGKNRPKAQRLKWATFWQMDCLRAIGASKTAHHLAVSLRLWNRAICIGFFAEQWRVPKLWQLRRSYRPNLWQMDCAQLGWRTSAPDALLALPLRVRDGARGIQLQPQKRLVSLMWLHDRRVCKEAVYQARYGGYQAAHDLAADAPALWQSQTQGVSLIWRERHQSLRALAGFRSVLGGYGSELSRGYEYRAHRQRWALRTRELCVGSYVRAVKEQKTSIGMEAK